MLTETLKGNERGLKFLSANKNGANILRLKREAFEIETDVPPPHLMQYQESPDVHLKGGKFVAGKMLEAFAAGAYSFAPGHRFLDFGCSNGRILRWFSRWAEQGEGWGVDINANTVMWCIEHLSPPFHFCVSSTAPQLPFEDRYFNLVFCNSIFTHIDDMFCTWLQELRRVTAIGGFLYVTIHDEATVKHMHDNPNSFLGKAYLNHPDFVAYVEKREDLLALGRDFVSQVFVRADYFESLIRPWFAVAARVEGTMGGHQPGYMLRRER